MGRGKNIITIMNRVQVVGANGAGVAYSRGSVIPWKKRIDEGFYKQKGGGFDMGPGGIFGTPKQRGGGWFDGLSQGMFGVKQTRGKKKRKPAIIHISATSYPQKGGGGKYGGFKGFFENPFHVREKLGVGNKGKKQKGGVLGLGKLEKWYGGKSKKEQEEIDAWTAKNL